MSNFQRALDFNERAEKLLEAERFSEALPLLQQVFLQFAKDEDTNLRVQVARALHGAARCYDHTGNAPMANSIRETMEKHFGASPDPKIRYWVELARGNFPTPPDETQLTAVQFESEWQDFLQTNQLDETPISASAPNSSPVQWISANEISLQQILGVFQNAYLEAEIDGDGDLCVRTENGIKILISINEANALLHFVAIYGLSEDASEAQKLAFVNRLNDEIILVRFSVANENTLVADYYLPYGQGVSPFHIVTVVRLMNRIIPPTFSKYDEDDVLS